jgi:corrinoid protein of di/trimethylamine methyltransferase
MDREAILAMMQAAIVEGDSQMAQQGAEEALKQGIDPLEVVELGLSPGMAVVGDSFECGDAFLPELLMAAETFDAAMEILKPEIAAQKKELAKMGTVVIGTVKGDLHNIGKNIVAMILETRGFTVVDLGIDVPSLEMIEGARKAQADVIALSCLMSTTMQSQREVLVALEELNLRDRFHVIVGGGPVTQAWADEIGADGYASNAIEAVTLVRKLLVPAAVGAGSTGQHLATSF